jgi:hypothetical protein
MSDAVCIFLNPARMVSPRDWAEAISGNGFDLQMDANFNPRQSRGFLPCIYRGRPAGFEYGYEVLERPASAGQAIGDPARPVRVTLGAGSNHAGFASSVVAGGVLCAITDGILRDPGTGELVQSGDAIAWARRHERELGARAAEQADPTWKTVCLNLAVAYAVAVIFTTYLSPPNDLAVLMLGPLLLVAVSGIFGLAVLGVVRLRKSLYRRFRPRLVWLVSTWIALILSLVDPFLPAPPTQSERTQESDSVFGRGGAR